MRVGVSRDLSSVQFLWESHREASWSCLEVCGVSALQAEGKKTYEFDARRRGCSRSVSVSCLVGLDLGLDRS